MYNSTNLEVSEVNAVDAGNPYGFHEKDSTFGVRKKRVYYPNSDFSFQLINFVSAMHHTGYLCKVTREIDEKSRYIATCDGMRKLL